MWFFMQILMLGVQNVIRYASSYSFSTFICFYLDDMDCFIKLLHGCVRRNITLGT